MIHDMLKDNFSKFIDKKYYSFTPYEITQQADKYGHELYGDSIFIHRNPKDIEEDYSYTLRTVDRFRNLCKNKKYYFFYTLKNYKDSCHIPRWEDNIWKGNESDYKTIISKMISAYNYIKVPNKYLIFINYINSSEKKTFEIMFYNNNKNVLLVNIFLNWNDEDEDTYVNQVMKFNSSDIDILENIKKFIYIYKMKIFIFGSNGMLGNYIKSYLSQSYEIIGLTRKDYDLSKLSINTLEKLLQNKYLKKNDLVINCAGVIPQASQQRGLNTRLYFTINSLFPVILSQICDKLDAKIIHITTDCVFSGKGGNYNENSIHDEINDYGMSKSLGELCKATIIRTSIIGEEVYNKRSLLEWVKSNSYKEINGYTNHYWNGVTCLQLAKIVEKIISTNNFWNGIRHIYSPISVSKYELVSIINDVYDLNIKINNFEPENSIDKTLTTIYDTNSKFNIPELKIQIQELKNFDL